MLIALLASAVVGSAQAAVTCTPDYQVTHSACIQGPQTGSAPQEAKGVRVNEGACHPDEQALCQETDNRVKFASSKAGVSADSVHVLHASSEVANGKFCNDGSNKRDVYCDYGYQAPAYQMLTDASCPIDGAQDVNSCFANPGSVSVPYIQSCMSTNPSSVEIMWENTACMVDTYKAIGNGSLSESVLGFKGMNGLNGLLHDIYYGDSSQAAFIDGRLAN